MSPRSEGTDEVPAKMRPTVVSSRWSSIQDHPAMPRLTASPLLSVTSPSVPASQPACHSDLPDQAVRRGVADGARPGKRSVPSSRMRPRSVLHLPLPLPLSLLCAALPEVSDTRNVPPSSPPGSAERRRRPCTSSVESFRYRHDPSGSTTRVPGEHFRFRSLCATPPITATLLIPLFQLGRP